MHLNSLGADGFIRLMTIIYYGTNHETTNLIFKMYHYITNVLMFRLDINEENVL